MRYPFVFYVDSLPPNIGGVANGFIIRILKKYKDDVGILKHELLHVKYWFFSLSLSSVLYSLSDKYKLWEEVQAYKEQLKHYPDDRTELFAEYISRYYNLAITKDEAEALLRR